MEYDLEVEINWFDEKVKEDGTTHIIFKITNNARKAVILTGYKMINRRDENKESIETLDWQSKDSHFNIVLWPRDKHEFHWNNVSISEYYRMKKGLWNTYVQVRYIQQDSDELKLSNIAEAKIEVY